MSKNFDALLVVSFGGPEGMADVMPFLENVLRGRNVPRERMMEVAHHYERFGGVSPINAQNRALIAALKEEFDANGINLPIYWGNRNWHPMLTDTLKQMKADGIKHALAFFTSAYSSYSGCRQYRENIAAAQTHIGDGAPQISLLRKFYNHPGFIEPNADVIRDALMKLSPQRRLLANVAFTAHSIPVAMAQASSYEKQLQESCRLTAEMAGVKNWSLVYQSRSGSPTQPWLGPDIAEHLRAQKDLDTADIIVSPIGFISDHMEVLYDLDIEAKELAQELGMNLIRVPTAGTHPRFVWMIRELVEERLSGKEKLALGDHGPRCDTCPTNCCQVARPQPQESKGTVVAHA